MVSKREIRVSLFHSNLPYAPCTCWLTLIFRRSWLSFALRSCMCVCCSVPLKHARVCAISSSRACVATSSCVRLTSVHASADDVGLLESVLPLTSPPGAHRLIASNWPADNLPTYHLQLTPTGHPAIRCSRPLECKETLLADYGQLATYEAQYSAYRTWLDEDARAGSILAASMEDLCRRGYWVWQLSSHVDPSPWSLQT